MSIGTFSTNLKTEYRYGLATRVKPTGVMMDIDRILKQTVDKDNVRAKVTAYNRATGPSMSLNENLIPEQLFDDPKTTEKEAQGISAVKALQIAAQQGQTIYTVTKANYAEILPKLNHSTDVMTDVKNAINAGKEVTISQTQVHAFGWSGTGYIVLDPKTGVGGYLIGGGADGGFTNWIKDNGTNIGLVLAFAGLFALGLGFANLSMIIGVISIIIATYLFYLAYIDAINGAKCPKALPCIKQIFLATYITNMVLSFIALFASPVVALALTYSILLYGDSLATASSKGCNYLACRPTIDG